VIAWRSTWAAMAFALAGASGCSAILGLDDPFDGPDTIEEAPLDGAVTRDSAIATTLDAPADVLLEASDADADGSARDAAPACDPTKPFGVPALVAGTDLNTAADEGTPRLSPDERTLYFWSNRNDGGAGPTRIYVATRSSSTEAFGAPTLLSPPGASWNEASPTVSADGTTLVFESDHLTGARGQLFVATRAADGGSFGLPALLANVNSALEEATPYLRPDRQELYFTADHGDGMNLYRALLQSDGSYGNPGAVTELSSSSDEYSTCVSSDDRMIVWGSKRSDIQNYGDFDIYVANRANAADGFGSLSNAGQAVNSPALDLPGWISPDGCSLYMESERSGQRDLYVARRLQ